MEIGATRRAIKSFAKGSGIQPITTPDPKREAPARVVILMLFIAVSSATAFASTPPINLGDALGSIEVVRCHFAEGRIVIRFGDGLHVLHEGDRLETANLNVVEINADSATLTLRSGDPTGSLRIVRVTNPSADVISLREFSTDPAALASTDTAKTAPIGTKHDVAPGSPSDG